MKTKKKHVLPGFETRSKEIKKQTEVRRALSVTPSSLLIGGARARLSGYAYAGMVGYWRAMTDERLSVKTAVIPPSQQTKQYTHSQ